jgi:hypothetical protein
MAKTVPGREWVLTCGARILPTAIHARHVRGRRSPENGLRCTEHRAGVAAEAGLHVAAVRQRKADQPTFQLAHV